MTPLGAPVDPELYCSKARSSRPAGVGIHALTDATTSSTSSQGVSLQLSSCSRAVRIIDVVDRTTAAPESRAIAFTRAAPRPCRGAAEGTATTFAYKHARKAATKSFPGRNI